LIQADKKTHPKENNDTDQAILIHFNSDAIQELMFQIKMHDTL